MSEFQIDPVILSKTISHALRHEPWAYELELDEDGWVELDQLISALKTENKQWTELSQFHIVELIRNSEKKRHELKGSKIRALYGHTVPGKFSKIVSIPPEILYHGTSPEALENIALHGILPMQRQYVHLSTHKEEALRVGKRKAKKPVILTINALDAHKNGINFYSYNNIWLVDLIPPHYIQNS